MNCQQIRGSFLCPPPLLCVPSPAHKEPAVSTTSSISGSVVVQSALPTTYIHPVDVQDVPMAAAHYTEPAIPGLQLHLYTQLLLLV